AVAARSPRFHRAAALNLPAGRPIQRVRTISTPLASSPSAYRESAILTATPEQLVVMLYDGARRFLYQASVVMQRDDVPAAHGKLRRAEAIISHLRDTLDLDQGDVAARLQAIYLFCNRHLNEA